MRIFLTFLKYEALGLLRRPQELGLFFLFLIPAVSLFGIIFGQQLAQRSKISMGILWVLIVLAQNLTTGKMFEDDEKSGTLEGMKMSPLSFEWIVLGKVLIQWVRVFVPLSLFLPILFMILGLEASFLPLMVGTLFIGTLVLVSLGTLGSALCLKARHGGVLAPLILAPFQIPTLIFAMGVLQVESGRPFFYLAALGLFALPLGCLATAFLLRSDI